MIITRATICRRVFRGTIKWEAWMMTRRTMRANAIVSWDSLGLEYWVRWCIELWIPLQCQTTTISSSTSTVLFRPIVHALWCVMPIVHWHWCSQPDVMCDKTKIFSKLFTKLARSARNFFWSYNLQFRRCSQVPWRKPNWFSSRAVMRDVNDRSK